VYVVSKSGTISVVFFVVVLNGSTVSEGIGPMTIAGATLGLIVVIAVAGDQIRQAEILKAA